MNIKFTLNANKAMQTLLWILNKKPDIDVYNINKIMFSADCYSLNHFGRPIYGERYVAMKFGTVPSFMYDLTKVKSNVPYYHSSAHGLTANAKADDSLFSGSDVEALEHGIKEYGNLDFSSVKSKNHEHPAWVNRIGDLSHYGSVDIPYEDMINNKDVLEDLTELGSLTENMVF